MQITVYETVDGWQGLFRNAKPFKLLHLITLLPQLYFQQKTPDNVGGFAY
jgi:hypothetical protein